MSHFSPARRERIDGLAVFVAVGFATALGLIYALERVGAPDGFVEALGPLIALLAFIVIGASTRAANLPDFLAARRMLPAFYGGLAFAATAAGLVAALLTGANSVGDAPWRGIAAGLILSALIVAPRWRRDNASALGDVLATHFPAASTRIAFTIVLAAIGAFTAIAGFELASEMLVISFGASPRLARALPMLALAVAVVPGGLKGLLWSDAASGGGALLVGAIAAGLAGAETPAPFEPLRTAWRALLAAPLGDPGRWGREIAVAIAIAFFFALAAPAFGAGSPSRARRAGFAGLLLAALGVALTTAALPFLTRAAETSRTATALTGAAAWLPAVALARAGVFGTARARGLDLAIAYSRLTVLSSRRIALTRVVSLIVIGLCPLAGDAAGMDPGASLFLALAIGLAFATPSLLLAVTLPASSVSALATLCVSLVVAIGRAREMGAFPRGEALLLDALIAGAAGLVVGAAIVLVFPDSRKRTPAPSSDPFVDVPVELGG